jgi:hypothetical protein
MQDMINGLMEKVGLSEDKAKEVVAFLKDNASKIPGWFGDGLDSVKDVLGVGGDEDLFAGVRDQVEAAKKEKS